MKLWLQVLFAQGYLWRDTFPDELQKVKAEPRKIRLPTLIPLAMIVLVSLALVGDAEWTTAVPVLTLSLGWFMFRSYPLRADTLVGTLEFWISATWAGGAIALISAVVLAITTLATGSWGLVLLCMGAWLGIVTPWLRGVEANYLILADPVDNSWRLDPQLNPRPSGIPSTWRFMISEAYWRLPRQIFFGAKVTKPPAQGGIE